jgi:hypothetical protein
VFLCWKGSDVSKPLINDPIIIEQMINKYYELKSIQKVAKIFGYNSGATYAMLVRNKVDLTLDRMKLSENKRKYSLDVNYFEDIDNSNKAYVLGLLFADGCMRKSRKQIQLRLTDLDLLESIKKEINFGGDLSKKTHKKHYKDTQTLTVCNIKMYDDLIKLGCLPAKSYDNKFPNIDSKYMPSFVRGFFDGNGSIYVARDSRNNSLVGEMVICSSTIFCAQLKEYFNNIGISSVLFRDKLHDERIGKIRIRRMDDLLRFYNLLYNDNNKEKIFLKRKHDKFVKYITLRFGEEYAKY